MSATANPPDLHREVQAALDHDDHDQAFDLLRRQAAATIDVDLLNDLAVVAHAAGRTGDAVHLLHAARLIEPGREDLSNNLRALEAPVELSPTAASVPPPTAPVSAETGSDDGVWYPMGQLSVTAADRDTVETFKASGGKVFAELGIYRGHHHRGDRRAPRRRRRDPSLRLEDIVVQELAGPVARPRATRTSCAHGQQPQGAGLVQLVADEAASSAPVARDGGFDYVFIDGAHTWGGRRAGVLPRRQACCASGGHVDFDDYTWRPRGISPDAESRRCSRQPPTMYTAGADRESRGSPKVVDLLVKRDARYVEIVPNKIYKKLAA